MDDEDEIGEDLKAQMRRCARRRMSMAEVMAANLAKWMNGPLHEVPPLGTVSGLDILLRDMIRGVAPEKRPIKQRSRSQESSEISFLVIYVLRMIAPGRYKSGESFRAQMDRYHELFKMMLEGAPMPEDARETVEEARELFHRIWEMGNAQTGHLASGHASDDQ